MEKGKALRLAALLGCFMSVLAETSQAQVPTINIQETCRKAAEVMFSLAVGSGGRAAPTDQEICLENENKSRDQISKSWSTFEASDREGCIQIRAYLPSYSEWLTCFEMNKLVREARQKQGRAMSSFVTGNAVTLPAVSSLGINMGGSRYWPVYRQAEREPPSGSEDDRTSRSPAPEDAFAARR
jgi:hypothetical protein